jgi:hypothetical protein
MSDSGVDRAMVDACLKAMTFEDDEGEPLQVFFSHFSSNFLCAVYCLLAAGCRVLDTAIFVPAVGPAVCCLWSDVCG